MRRPILPLLILLICAVNAWSIPLPKNPKAVPLCLALENIDTGEEIPVTVSGIYALEAFYDPEDPLCNLKVERSTCVEFSSSLERPIEFEALHRSDLRVYATFQGVLYGFPHAPDIENTALPIGARLVAANTALYCANNGYRTRLIVDSILDFAPVPESTPWHPRAYRKDFPSNPPVPVSLTPPDYPPFARELGIEGVVLIEVTVTAGTVTGTIVKFGDPALSGEAQANLLTWQFPQEISIILTVRFEYRLERRSLNEDENPRIEMHLPGEIRITGTMPHL